MGSRVLMCNILWSILLADIRRLLGWYVLCTNSIIMVCMMSIVVVYMMNVWVLSAVEIRLRENSLTG